VYIKLYYLYITTFEKDVQIVGDFRDIGIFRDLLLLIMQRTASKKVDNGCVFENAVFNTLDRRFNKVNYYQTKTGQEIDFVVPDEKMAFEVKYSGAGYDYQKLNRLPTKLDLKNFYVVTHNFDKRAGFIPALDL